MAYELVLAAAGFGPGAWFVAASTTPDRARQRVAMLLAAAPALRFVAAAPLAENLLFASIAIGILPYRCATTEADRRAVLA